MAVQHDILIAGANARAAAFSAIRCGLRPRCADYFADRDLAAICPVDRIDPGGAADLFEAWARSIPGSTWFYTGGFENHPEWVDRISGRHRLWGVNAEALRRVRDPFAVAEALMRAGVACPEARSDCDGLPRDGTWLVKPLRSCGGRGIGPLTGEHPGESVSHYFQKRIEGPGYSAVFISDGGDAELIGVTRQSIGGEGGPFVYRGSIGPWPIDAALASRLRSLGNRLVSVFGLVGWFGVDYILNDGVPWPVEVNPRYSASFEIHELATGRSLLAAHRDACEGMSRPEGRSAAADRVGSRVVAKLMLYAPRRMIAPDIDVDDNPPEDPFALRSIADIPWPGTWFERGEPVMTILAEGADLTSCQANLDRLEQTWRGRLGFDGD